MQQNFIKNQRKIPFPPSRFKKWLMELFKKYPKISSIFILLNANVFNNLVTFVINIFIAKKFGPENFGIFSLAVSTLMTVHLVTNLGLSLAMVRYFNLYNNDAKQQNVLLLSLLFFRFSIIFLLITVSFPIGILLINIFRISNIYLILFSLAIMTGGILNLWVYLQNFMQVHRQFPKLATYVALYGVFRLVCFLLLYLFYSKQVNLTTLFSSLYSAPLVIIIIIGIIPIILNLLPRGIPSFSDILITLQKVFKYSKWVAISGICYSLIYRLVQFILACRSSKFELGILSAGFVFTVAFSTLNMAVRTVFFPHVTAFEETKDMKKHFARVKKIFPYYIILTVISITILAFIQILFLGSEYTAALPVFLITSVALALTIIMGLISMLLHTLMRPEVDAFVNIGRLITATILVYCLGPSFGAIGGAVGYALPVVFGELYMVIFVGKMINEKSTD